MELNVHQINPIIQSVRGVQRLPEELNDPETPLRSYRLLYAAGGSFEVTWDQKSFLVSENCAFLFLPDHHYTAHSEERSLQLIDIRFDIAFGGKKHTKVQNQKFFSAPLLLESSPQSKRSFEGILWEAKKKRTLSREIAELYLKTILLGIIRDIREAGKNNLSDAARKITRYVHEHITENIQNDSAARALSYHPNYINRVIKKATGMTFHKYVVDEKLHYATSLLLNTNDSITEIACALGFNTSSHFSSLFAEKYHCTPSRYRKGNS